MARDQITFDYTATNEYTGEHCEVSVKVADNGEPYCELDDTAIELATPKAARELDCAESAIVLAPR